MPGWGVKLTIRELGLQESMQAFGDVKPDDDGNVTLSHNDIAKIVSLGVVDPESGERAFTDKDVPILARKGKRALMFLYMEITKLSSTIEDEAKN